MTADSAECQPPWLRRVDDELAKVQTAGGPKARALAAMESSLPETPYAVEVQFKKQLELLQDDELTKVFASMRRVGSPICRTASSRSMKPPRALPAASPMNMLRKQVSRVLLQVRLDLQANCLLQMTPISPMSASMISPKPS